MLALRRDEEIHHEAGGWFDARWHFSFDRYRDPEHMGVGALRVFNDDRLVPGANWPMHPHRDIESLTYVVEGRFAHADSLGNGGVLERGAAQVMRFSSRGAHHSERNGSDDEPLRFIQFWILPSDEDLDDSVEQKQYTEEDRTDRWLQIMGPEGTDGLDLAQDARTLVSRLTAGQSLTHTFEPGRGGYVYVIEGAATFDGTKVKAGDAAEVEGPHDLTVESTGDPESPAPESPDTGPVEATELILVDVPLDFEPVGIWAGRR